MATNFPVTGLDVLTNPAGTDKVSVVDHAAQHANANDAVEALEAKVGVDGSAVTTSHDYKLSGVTGSDLAVSKTGTETLTNKTLTAPVISTISNTGTVTLPTSTDTLVGKATTDTLTNKTLTSPVIDTGVSGTAILDEDNMTSDSATKLATQQSIKAYVDSSVSGGGSVTAVAAFDTTAGKPVGLNINGKAAIANYSATGLGSTNLPDTATGTIHVAEIGGKKFAVLYLTATNTAKVAIATWDSATQTTSFGSSVTVSTDIGSEPEMAVTKLDTDKFVVTFIGNTDNTKLYSIAYTVSGTVPSAGSTETLYTHGSALFAFHRAEQLGTNKIAAYVCRSAATSYGGLLAVTYSGTTATAGSPGALNTTYFIQSAFINNIATDKIVVNSAGTQATQIVTFSGTTPTVGTAQTFSITGTWNATSGSQESHTTDAFIIASSSYAMAVTVSGTVATFGTEAAHGTSSGYLLVYNSIPYMYSSILSKVNLSGSTISSFTNMGRFASSSNMRKGFVSTGTTDFFIFASSSTVLRTFSSECTASFIGFAQSAVSAGANVSLLYSGIDANQSGLSPGQWYFIDSDGVLTVVSGGTLPSTTDEHYFTRALSATQIVI